MLELRGLRPLTAGFAGASPDRRGTAHGEQLNCADLQIATSLALVDYRLDLRPELRRRPAGELMERVLPETA